MELLALILLGIYFAPAIVAAKRRHHNTLAIFMLTLLLGWSGVVWVFALVWSLTAVRDFRTAKREVRAAAAVAITAPRRGWVPIAGALACTIVVGGAIAAIGSAGRGKDAPATARPVEVANLVTGSIPARGPQMDPRKAALLDTRLNAYRWRTDGFGTVMMLTGISVENGNARGIKDIRISCEVFAPSGTTLNVVSGTIYDRVPTGKIRTFRELNMGFVNAQAASASCRIVSVDL